MSDVTATENALMAAVAAAGTTVLRNAASEPHVQDLARYLVGLGGRIDGIGSNTLTVEGGAPLRPAPFTNRPGPHRDRIVRRARGRDERRHHDRCVRADDLRATLLAFERLGVRPRLDRAKLIVDAARSAASDRIWAVTSPSSRTAPGPRSPPT